ncbi:MAG: Mut7-C RNAse domain-containing protein [Thermoplasmatales archaeon]|nr:MAG: Mut7-C RNAse domain-containing protein [Thermoplasmatales archaeon]
MKFLCDQMLGTLAKWMRIFGFDTFYANGEIDDKELIDICSKENRILITRDKILIQIARRENLKTIDINTIDIDEQIKKVISDREIDLKKVLSRCILCNTAVDEIKKDEVKDKVLKKVYDNNEKFWLCKKCDKIYWKGSHYENMIDKINEIKKLL